ncbi:MAG: metallophosphoesterase [Bacillota bacterium]|nr:metallophosphoesterase [Bacillota bacterium]
MKLIHCSDLHLDSKMEALPPHKAKERGSEILLSLESMVEFALNNGVTAIMIAGDMFDTQRVSPATVSFVLDIMRRAKGIDFLYLRGNHDESRFAFTGRELPENLHLFSEIWQSYDYGEAVIWGAELNAHLYDELPFDKSRCNIVMLHGQVSTETGDGLVCLPRLRNRGISYLALGHIHSYAKERLDLDGYWCYCGCLEGRGFDECGEKGFVLIETGDGGLHTRFVPFAKRRLHNVEVDISGLEAVSEIREAMRIASAHIDRGDLVKFTLTGNFSTDTQKDTVFLRRAFEDEFYHVKIKDESRLAISREDYIHDISLKGAFIRGVMDSEMDGEEKERIILCGLRALAGEEADV